jgi:hypothetical protein
MPGIMTSMASWEIAWGRLVGTEANGQEAEVKSVNTTVLQPGDGRSVWVVGDLYTFLATGEDTNGAYALIHATVHDGASPTGASAEPCQPPDGGRVLGPDC